jgi:heavy metal sensor kinase
MIASLRRGFATLRVRLTLWYVLLLALILAGFCTFIYLRLLRDLYTEADRLLVDEARGLLTALQTGDESNVDGLLADVPAGTIVIVTDTASGRELTSQSGSPQAAADLGAMAIQPVSDTSVTDTSVTNTSVRGVTLAGDPTWRLATLTGTDANHTEWIVRVARSDRDVVAALRQLLVQMAFGVPLALLVAIASGLFLAARALNPIDAITRTAAQIGAEDLGRRLGLRGRDELARLAATFDGMLDRLERAFEQQRQFTADASHELRTPLAMLMSQIDIALERPRSTEQYQDTLRSMREDVAELSRLVSELLMLARAEAGREPLAAEQLDLAELASGVASSMEPLASARNIHLVAQDCGDAPIVGDETRLMQLVVNLVDNAIKYTPPGGVVTVATRRESEWAIVEVADTGPGIRPEHRQRIFERFFRVDSARSRSGGAGLGLAISRWIAEAHGGEIRVESGPRGGTSFCVRLPGARVPAPVAS